MVAATIQDNRYIVIRGLGGRYSTTLLNGVPLPSPDPDFPAAPLDLFPAALIANLTVNKTFAPDMPGNFAGGALGIETRNYPTKFLFKAKVGIAGNSTTSFRTLNGQDGGSRDFLGYDDGSRSLPSGIPADQLAGRDQLSAAQRDAQVAAFKSDWSIDRGMVGPNLTLGATIGGTRKVSDQRLGYFGSVSFGHGYVSRRTHIARVGGSDKSGGTAPSVLQLDDRQGIEQANLGALAGAGWTPASGHKLDLFTLYAHTADINASQITGTAASTWPITRSVAGSRRSAPAGPVIFTRSRSTASISPAPSRCRAACGSSSRPPTCSTGAAALTAGTTPPNDPFFDATASFAGAIGTDDWTLGWTKYPQS